MGFVAAGFVAGITFSAAATTGMTFVIASVVQGALIGAAIGGLTAAVNGGDIGQGMLTGAVGGAVMGGISGLWGAYGMEGVLGGGVHKTQTSLNASNATKTAAAAELEANKGLVEQSRTIGPDGKITVNMGQPETKFLGMSGDTLDVAGQAISGAAQGLLGKADSVDIGDQAAAQLELQKQAQEAAAQEAALGRTASMEQLQAQLGTQLATSEANIEEQRRQYDVSATAAAARQRDAGTGRGVLTIGQGTETTAGYDPALRNVLDNELYTNVAKG